MRMKVAFILEAIRASMLCFRNTKHKDSVDNLHNQQFDWCISKDNIIGAYKRSYKTGDKSGYFTIKLGNHVQTA